MKLYLDDVRPVPPGWVLAKTVPEAIELLKQGVDEASLDHDLGLCDQCWEDAKTLANDNPKFKLNLDFSHKMAWNHGLASYASCVHNGTGYDLVCWMEEHDVWPAAKPTVHSANPVGAARMRQVIDKKFKGDNR